jgi:hypothetical protein
MNALQTGCFTVFAKLNIYRFYYVYLLTFNFARWAIPHSRAIHPTLRYSERGASVG